jgi:hypothetical protein
MLVSKGKGRRYRRRGQGSPFPLGRRSTGTLTVKAMNRIDAWRMVQRRAAELGTKVKIGCHIFRATGITTYLEAGGTLENAQAMAAHESPRTTKLYDRTDDAVTLDEVERITICNCSTNWYDANRSPLEPGGNSGSGDRCVSSRPPLSTSFGEHRWIASSLKRNCVVRAIGW